MNNTQMVLGIFEFSQRHLGYALLIIIIIINLAIIFYKSKLEKIMSVPISIILILFYATIIGSSYWWIFTIKSFSELITFITLLVLALYTYYTLQVVKIAYSGPALLHVQIEHSKTLKLFLRKWSDLLNEIPEFKNIPYQSFEHTINNYKSLEENWEYNDLIEHHLPKNYRDLKNNWDNYRRQLEDLELKSNVLYKSILYEVDAELSDMKTVESRNS
ncbi:MAG: hypothetical protein M0Q13_15445 [Methanothrix sp.]|jgi:predicted membrane protein|nr:hypothetical protein [Methanothrix sp.]